MILGAGCIDVPIGDYRSVNYTHAPSSSVGVIYEAKQYIGTTLPLKMNPNAFISRQEST